MISQRQLRELMPEAITITAVKNGYLAIRDCDRQENTVGGYYCFSSFNETMGWLQLMLKPPKAARRVKPKPKAAHRVKPVLRALRKEQQKKKRRR